MRNYGIDLMRIVAMFMIAWGHVVRFSFNYSDSSLDHASLNYILLDLISNVCLVAVNVYAMISGYVMVGREVRVSKLIPMWLQLLFVSLAIAFAARIIHPNLVNKPLWKFAFPISQNCWWYMTAYFGMYPFLPFINRALKNMNKRELVAGGVFFWSCSQFFLP